MKPAYRLADYRVYRMNGLFVVIDNIGLTYGKFNTQIEAENEIKHLLAAEKSQKAELRSQGI